MEKSSESEEDIEIIKVDANNSEPQKVDQTVSIVIIKFCSMIV